MMKFTKTSRVEQAERDYEVSAFSVEHLDMINNPWLDLPANAPFVLSQDKLVLDKYSLKMIGDHAIRLDTLPYPYLGSPGDASVLLLALNGGFSDQNLHYIQNDPYYVDQRRRSLTFESDYPFFYLDPKLSYTLGHQWWYKRLRHFIEEHTLETVASRFACVQSFPYCSKRYKALPQRVPSQEYSFSLVRQAIKAGKLIVIMRSRKIWLQCVPELVNYPYIELKHPRNPYINRGHMTDSQFEQLEAAVN